MKCSGFLFDLDGTLINSLPTVEKCWLTLASRYQVDPQYVLNHIHGRKAADNVRLILPNADELLIQKEIAYMDKLETENVSEITEMAGASTLLHTLNELAIPWAIVTSGTKSVAEARYNTTSFPKPKVFITGNDVKNSKPAPDGYLMGAKALQLNPSQCVVFEDAIAGVQSAHNAHCQIVGINVPFDKEADKLINIKIKSLTELVILRCDNNQVEIKKSIE